MENVGLRIAAPIVGYRYRGFWSHPYHHTPSLVLTNFVEMRCDIPVLCRRVVAKISVNVANFVRVLSLYRLLQK